MVNEVLVMVENCTISDDIDPSGTSLMGEIDVSFAELVSVLGAPLSDGDGYKVDAEWVIKFKEANVIATIYNYKSGNNYNHDGTRVEDIRDWHIGGVDMRAVELVKELLRVIL